MSDYWLLPWAMPCAENLGVCNPPLADAETLGSPSLPGCLAVGVQKEGVGVSCKPWIILAPGLPSRTPGGGDQGP